MNSSLLLFNNLQLNVDLGEIVVIEGSDFCLFVCLCPSLWEDVSPHLCRRWQSWSLVLMTTAVFLHNLGEKTVQERLEKARPGEVITLRQPPHLLYGDVNEKWALPRKGLETPALMTKLLAWLLEIKGIKLWIEQNPHSHTFRSFNNFQVFVSFF